MMEGKRRDEWDRTSHIMAFIANQNRTKKDRQVTAAQCNPYLVAAAKANAPKLRDVGMLARMMGCDVPDDDERAKRRAARKAVP